MSKTSLHVPRLTLNVSIAKKNRVLEGGMSPCCHREVEEREHVAARPILIWAEPQTQTETNVNFTGSQRLPFKGTLAVSTGAPKMAYKLTEFL